MRKIGAIVLIILILSVAFFVFIVPLFNDYSIPPSFRITQMDGGLFVRWYSKVPLIGKIELDGKNYTENCPVMLHKIFVPHFKRATHMRIVEMDGKTEVYSFCINMKNIKNSPIIIGLYNYSEIINISVISKFEFEEQNFKIEKIVSNNFSSVQKLCSYDAVVFPNGDINHIMGSLTYPERENLVRYVKGGGSFLGISAGASMISKYVIWKNKDYENCNFSLYPGKLIGPLNSIEIFKNGTKIRWYTGFSSEINLTNASYFTYSSNISIIAIYGKTNRPGAIKFKIDGGRVLLFGFDLCNIQNKKLSALVNSEIKWLVL